MFEKMMVALGVLIISGTKKQKSEFHQPNSFNRLFTRSDVTA